MNDADSNNIINNNITAKHAFQVNAGVGLMRKYVSSAPLIKTLLSDFRQLYFEKVYAMLYAVLCCALFSLLCVMLCCVLDVVAFVVCFVVWYRIV